MDVDWNLLDTSTGNAYGVPAALEDLVAPSRRQRGRGYRALDNYVIVQGGLYNSAPFAARWLVDRLKAGVPEKQRDLTYFLLEEILLGGAPGEPPVDFPGLGEVSLEDACRIVIEEGAEIYAADIVSRYRDVRRAAIRICTVLENCRDEMRRKFEQAEASVINPFIRHDIRAGLAELIELENEAQAGESTED